MIKKEKMKTSILAESPYMYYITNWGFVEQKTTNTKSTERIQKRG